MDTVRAYHERTKHRFDRYAAGPGGLDWASQPDPFRSFSGCPRTNLPLIGTPSEPSFADLFQPGRIAAQAFSLSSVGALLELSFGLSAWKQFGESRWALRCNPSSGNLHPTEAYVVLAGCSGIDDGVHHYLSRDHLLEQRCRFTLPDRAPTGFLIGISSIHWREAWKYGERAFRYCQHDVGHAIGAVSYAAATLGWRVLPLSDWGDADVATLLGLDRAPDFGDAEPEHPDLLLFVSCLAAPSEPPHRDVLLRAAGTGTWSDHANRLSEHHLQDWPVIDAVAAATIKPYTQERHDAVPRPESPHPLATPLPAILTADCSLPAAQIIRQRRSAQALDGETSISVHAFFRMLDATLPRPEHPPWDAMPGRAWLHLALFVHRVDGLAPGLYLFLRNDGLDDVRAALSAEFEWVRVPEAPSHFSLWRLAQGDARAAARTLSCHQDIAADGAFSLAMLAEYTAALRTGPWAYRRLFWEAGAIGQALYLEAEAAAVRATGIGCYFDDPVHELLGLQDHTLQSLYHFTVGGALADARLQTLPPYTDLRRN